MNLDGQPKCRVHGGDLENSATESEKRVIDLQGLRAVSQT
jgi:hypothetical protein